MDRPRVLRLLRIAFSTVCGTLCLLLIVLWVRSMSVLDEFHLTTASRSNRANSLHGELEFVTETESGPGKFVKSWGLWSENFETEVILPPIPEYASLGFSLTAGKYELAIGVPLWFPVLLSATLVANPWLSWRSRFSLRTLLVATTLVAVVLGLAVACG